MTAITTVPAHLRGARVTPYLLAAALAVALWLLLGAHTAFAGDKSAAAQSSAQLGARPEKAEHHSSPAVDEETGSGGPETPARTEPPIAPPPVGQAHASRETSPRAEEPEAPAPGADHTGGTPGPAVQTVASEPPSQAQAPTADSQQEDAPASPPTTAPVAPHPASAVPLTRGEPEDQTPPRPQEQRSPEEALQATTFHEAGQETAGQEDDGPPAADGGPQPHRRPSAPAMSARQHSTVTADCMRPHGARGPFTDSEGGVTLGGDVVAETGPAEHSVLPERGLQLVATPSQALAPVFALRPRAALPAPRPVQQGSPPLPVTPPSGPFAAHAAAFPGDVLVGRLESAMTFGALTLLVPLLAFVLWFQMRLLRQMRALQGGSARPKRYYSISHEEVRQMGPDMVPALAHHRFCESERHRGRWRPARWLELEDTGTDVPLMWATCETCHHQRMSWINGREVQISRS